MDVGRSPHLQLHRCFDPTHRNARTWRVIDFQPIAGRLASLIRLLGSDNDGEALNAARAIGKALARQGGSFHDLAERVEKPLNGVTIRAWPSGGGGSERTFYETNWQDIIREGRAKKNARPAPRYQDMPVDDREHLMREALASGKLDSWGQQFVAGILRECENTVGRVNLTPRELEQINRLFATVWGLGVRI